jgi:cytochrome c nitrite reductase small subunit
MAWVAPLGRTGAVVAGMAVGLAMGAGAFTFWFGQGASYMTNDPAACANCHVMEEQYSGWMTASHRTAATCNDCHTPHNLVGKYVVKGRNGFWHSFAFTTGWFAEPIRIKQSNRAVTEQACRHCHGELARVVDGPGREEPLACITCHASVGHPH